jgi:hypothetical protein
MNACGRRDAEEIADSNEVTGLLYALLLLYFDDIVREDRLPDGVDVCRRGFLLNAGRIAVEVRYPARAPVGADGAVAPNGTDTGDAESACRAQAPAGDTTERTEEELARDIEYYRARPGCEKFFGYIYDPNDLIRERHEIASALNARHDGFAEIIADP